jgi:hypothetical protein
MNIDRTIAEIERLERIFAVPDTRPLSASDLSAANRSTTKCSRTVRGFGFGSILASVAALMLPPSDQGKSRAKLRGNRCPCASVI